MADPVDQSKPFDFGVLESITQQAGERAKAIPAQETTFIDTLNTLSEEQAQIRTSTMTAKASADQKASTYMVENQSVQKRILAANANPFHDLMAFFTDDQSTDELLAEQQKVAHNVSTLANGYQNFAAGNQFKQQSLQAQIDKIKTIEAVRSGNTAELSSLLSTYKGAQLNQNAIVMDELDKLTLDELHANVQKNETSYNDGLVQLAYWDRLSKDSQRRELVAKNKKHLTNAEYLTINSPSVRRNEALMAAAQENGQDVINIKGRNIPTGDMSKWNAENRAPLEEYMNAGVFLNTARVEAFSTISQMENLLPATLGSRGADIASALRVPMIEMSEEEKIGVLKNVQNGLMLVPVPLQADFAQLTKLRMQYARVQKDESAAGVTVRANLEKSMTHTAGKIRDNLGKIIINKYSGNKQATAGATEYIATGKIDNATSATAIIQSQVITSTGMALDAATLDTYYEGSLSLIGESLDTQMRAVYESEQAAAPMGASGMEFMAWLNQKNTKAPPEEFMMRKAIEANAVQITKNAFGKISNIHLAGALRSFASKWKDIPEVANVAIQMQDGIQLSGALADPNVQAPKEIMTMLRKLETQLKEKKIIEPTVNLVEEFKLAALDRELVKQAITVLQPRNELTASIDTLLFRGSMDTIYMRNIAKNFSRTTIANIDKAEVAVVEEQVKLNLGKESVFKHSNRFTMQ